MRNLLSNYQRIWIQDDRNKVESKFETYCSTTVRCGHGQIRQCQRCLTSESCTYNLTQNRNQSGTSLHNGEIALARHVNAWRWKSGLYIQQCWFMENVRVCEYEYWIKWARLLSPMHHENARKTGSSSNGLPLKSKSVKTWETEVWRWSLLHNEKPIVDVSTQLTTRCSKQGWIKIFETYCSTIVQCGHDQIWQCQRGLTSESCTSNRTEIQISA